ncbi:MAG: CapA family protein, partial [Clostridia bacterium]|nr:CapA family protein [Clostridia bacterium]
NHKYRNGNALASEGTALVNSCSYQHIDDFYAEAEQTIAQMKAQNADAIVFYLHWGVEYRLSPNDWQKTIAQKLCDLGVDVIVGGHPHVVEPMELLHASGSDHTTVCLYSMGNAVSNQRRDQMTGCCETGHTEDGVLFYYTFKKYSDGTTVLSGVDVIPTWVGMEKTGHKNGIYTARYTVYPLESRDYGAMNFGLSGSVATGAQNSYDRTKALLQEGLTECQEYLKCNVRWPEDTP